MNKSFIEKMCAKRDKQVLSSYKKGESLELIEAFFGITKQRIYQILKKYNVKSNRINGKRA